MKFQNPFVVSDEDKAKLKAAAGVVGDAFPSVNIGWKPGRKALDLVGKAIPSVKVTWKKAQEEATVTDEQVEELARRVKDL